MIKPYYAIGFLFFFMISCTHAYHYTYSQKSAIEQLLVSKAVDESLKGMALDIKNSKIFVDVACLMVDQGVYIRKAIAHRFLEAGIPIIESRSDADYIVSVLVKVAGTDGEEDAFGLPAIPVPVVNIASPALTILGRNVQEGRVEMEIILYSPKEGIKEKIPFLSGKSYYKKYVIFFIPYTKKDIP